MLASRSILRYVQDGFIAEPPWPKREPHKNLRLAEALRLATDWGCDIREAHGDALVYHQLIQAGGRRVPVSMGRRDTSQVLVSFIRKVIEATTEYRKEHPVVRSVKGGLESAAPVSHINGVAVPMPAQPTDDERAASILDDSLVPYGITHLIAAAQLIHYRRHTLADALVPFDECDKDSCVKCRREIMSISQVQGDYADSLKIMSDQNLEIIGLKEQLAAAEAKIPKDTAPEKVTRIDVTNAPILAAALNDDQRRWTYFKFRDDLERLCTPWQGEGTATKTRLFEAFDMLAEKDGYSAAMLTAFQRMDFAMYRHRIMNLTRPGGDRHMVGLGAWNDFEATLVEARKKVPNAG